MLIGNFYSILMDNFAFYFICIHSLMNSRSLCICLFICSLVISPLTEAQSGESGKLTLAESLFEYSSSDLSYAGIEKMELHLSEACMNNIDTVHYPLSVIVPSGEHTLDNELTIGTSSRSLEAGMQLEVLLLSDYFDMDDVVQLRMKLDTASIDVSIMAIVLAKSLMEFPLSDLSNLNCWLATIPAPELDEDGMSISETVSLFLAELAMSVDRSKLDISCVSCTSSGMQELQTIIDSLDGIFSVVVDDFVEFMVHALTSDFTQIQLDRMVNSAASMCPHHDLYVGSEGNDKSYELPEVLLLTSDTLDMFVLSGVGLFEAGLAVLSINLEDYDVVGESDELSAENDLSSSIPTEVELLDLSEGLIGLLLNETGSYLGGFIETSEGGAADLGINVLMRSSILDEDGLLTLSLSNSSSMMFATEGVELSVSEVRVFGLDSFREFGSLSAIGAQTLQVDFVLGEVAIEMDIDLSVLVSDASTSTSRSSSSHEEHITARFVLKGLSVDLSFLLAVDLSKLDGMELGPLLFSENILPCMLSTLYTGVNVTKLSMSLSNADPFELKGFRSSGVDDAIASATASLFGEYGDAISAALPALMDIVGRSAINEFLSLDTEGESSKSMNVCPDVPESSKDGFVDYRDLFMNATSALGAGGSGDMPYGDMMVLAKRLVDDELVAADPETGLPRVNRY